MHKKMAIGSLLVILVLVNWSIAGKEKHLAEGKEVYLKLAPVDPRSLMQGDYMALRFRLSDEVYKILPKTKDRRRWRHDVAASDGFVVASLDERNVGTFKDIYKDQSISDNEVLLRYRVRHGTVKFATNAYFFQEGHGRYYQPAEYGQFRVDGKGELLLVAMYDKDLKKLGPKEKE